MFPLATPLGVKSHKTGVVMLNPEDDYVLMAGGWTGWHPWLQCILCTAAMLLLPLGTMSIQADHAPTESLALGSIMMPGEGCAVWIKGSSCPLGLAPTVWAYRMHKPPMPSPPCT